ncbi:hypothetical protein ENU1_164540 [Entamoeba nuttalli P19]|uniref:Uncharacterized protein n=1 Tax=Entamoeba nuttalli (strain P19) TaxID=1076696 RepID=K2H7J9_ENTNP|nr:hypothetical protein ENU1_164540 [Entamoeba nuttalli P19]EKE38499.1 hypothetical protein ENU1_164540 [Entamoeba nuttalli P19]|eukprot:XP_008859180.1 hypothetical protein ENU1_164540 [Entamoeba nuttalli P19]
MSTRRGNTKKLGQKHQNITAFKDYKGCTVYKKIKALPNEGLCQKCHDTIEWKKKFHKYKPLKVPGVCLICKQKNIRYAYHTVCQECAIKEGICAKCREKKQIVNGFKVDKQESQEDQELQVQIERLSLRQKQSFFRQLEKNPDCDQQELLKQFQVKEKDEDWDSFDDDSDYEEDESNNENKNETGSEHDDTEEEDNESEEDD